MTKLTLIIAILGSVLSTASADDNINFDDSLNKTQNLLKNESERNKAISESEEGKKADAQVKKIAPDSITQDEYYELGADIMGNFKNAKDEESMIKSITDAKHDPSAFYNSLTPEQREKIKKLSEKLNPGVQTNP